MALGYRALGYLARSYRLQLLGLETNRLALELR